MNDPLTAEQFGAILWPGMFKQGWQNISSEDASFDSFFQAQCYCLKKAEELLEKIEVRYKSE